MLPKLYLKMSRLAIGTGEHCSLKTEVGSMIACLYGDERGNGCQSFHGDKRLNLEPVKDYKCPGDLLPRLGSTLAAEF